tara:strand:- start:1986 stop:2258 length:273 start_codon:yes stop_codon:yes gene_type:complete
MKSLILMSYKQPVDGRKFRWGVLESIRDTKKDPITLPSAYRVRDHWNGLFRRSQNLATVKTRDGLRAFYLERAKWAVKIPFVGSLISRFI